MQIHQENLGRNSFECIFDSCNKQYLYQSSLKKHYLLVHAEQYHSLVKEKKIKEIGF